MNGAGGSILKLSGLILSTHMPLQDSLVIVQSGAVLVANATIWRDTVSSSNGGAPVQSPAYAVLLTPLCGCSQPP